jgi:hypothetical protein
VDKGARADVDASGRAARDTWRRASGAARWGGSGGSASRERGVDDQGCGRAASAFRPVLQR